MSFVGPLPDAECGGVGCCGGVVTEAGDKSMTVDGWTLICGLCCLFGPVRLAGEPVVDGRHPRSGLNVKVRGSAGGGAFVRVSVNSSGRYARLELVKVVDAVGHRRGEPFLEGPSVGNVRLAFPKAGGGVTGWAQQFFWVTPQRGEGGPRRPVAAAFPTPETAGWCTATMALSSDPRGRSGLDPVVRPHGANFGRLRVDNDRSGYAAGGR